MRCLYCRQKLQDVHGHLACVNGSCAMFGVPQAGCCGDPAVPEPPPPPKRHDERQR